MNADLDLLKEWLTSKLSIERITLEVSHAAILDEFYLKLQEINLTVDKATDPPPKDTLVDSAILPTGGNDDVISEIVAPEKNGLQVKEKEKRAMKGGSFAGMDEEVTGNRAQKMVKSKQFEIFFAAAIITNILVMVLESQYAGIGLGYKLGYPKYQEPKEKVWGSADDVFLLLDYVFGIVYTIEIVSKVIAWRLHFFFDPWNVLDVVIIIIWFLERFVSGVDMPIDTMLFRLLRLARLFHLVKVVHTLAHFEQLFLMLTALRGCLRMLFWAGLVLCACLVSVALLLNQVLATYVMDNAEQTIEVKTKCFLYFGTFTRSMFSMFELTLANWIPVSRFLIEDVNEAFVLFAICYKLSFGFAVISVINGCFIKETFKIAEHDDFLMILQKEEERKVHYKKMMHLMAAADADGDGEINKQEFCAICNNPAVNKWLGAMGLRASDSEGLFDLLDDGDGKLTPSLLVQGTNKLKGPARSLDLARLSAENGRREGDILQKIDDVASNLATNQSAMRANQATTHENQASLKAAAESTSETVAGMQVQLAQLTNFLSEVKETMGRTQRLPPAPPAPVAVQAPITPGPVVRDAAIKRQGNWGCS